MVTKDHWVNPLKNTNLHYKNSKRGNRRFGCLLVSFCIGNIATTHYPSFIYASFEWVMLISTYLVPLPQYPLPRMITPPTPPSPHHLAVGVALNQIDYRMLFRSANNAPNFLKSGANSEIRNSEV